MKTESVVTRTPIRRNFKMLDLTEPEVDEFVTTLLTPERSIQNVFSLTRQPSGANEWEIMGDEKSSNTVPPDPLKRERIKGLGSFKTATKQKHAMTKRGSLLWDLDVL